VEAISKITRRHCEQVAKHAEGDALPDEAICSGSFEKSKAGRLTQGNKKGGHSAARSLMTT